ncbi:hypothetical protein AUJ38_03895 [bacterium CG1_02_42_9]|nr:MAG: hypothetical protein AUJ38_03895 [bacterium CG1_02_42_9]
MLIKNGIPVEQIIMFGSYAKNQARYDSDLDVAVVSKTFGKNSFREMVKLSKIALGVESLIEPHPYHPKDLKDKWDPLANEIRNFGKRII